MTVLSIDQTAEQVLAVVGPILVAAVDAWIHSTGSEKLSVAAARKTAEAAAEALEDVLDGPKPLPSALASLGSTNSVSSEREALTGLPGRLPAPPAPAPFTCCSSPGLDIW